MKQIVYIIMFLLLVCCAFAVDTNYVFKKNQNIDLKIPCFQQDSSYCPDTTHDCTITINYPDGKNLINNASMTYQNTYFNYTITEDKITSLGEYSAVVNCFSATENGFTNIVFEVTTEGSRIPMTTIFFIIIGFIYVLLVFALLKEEYTLTMLSSIGLLIIGVYMAINGIGNINNIMTQAFSLINIGVGAYILIMAGINEFQEHMGGD